MRRDRTERAEATRAVIVCAGTYASPQLLMLSGVGPAARLCELDIPVVHDLPGVGENLQDHPGLAQTCFASVPTYNTLMGPIGGLIYGAQWLLAGSGPASTPHSQVTAFLRHDMSEGRSDLQYMFTPAGYDLSADGPVLFDRPAVTGLINLLRPYSRGQVGLRSADPLAHSTIQPNLFADERDLALLLAGAKLQRKLFQTEPLARSIAGDYRPSSDVQTDDEWRAYLRENSLSGYHPVGTCKMGRDELAVVDHRLRVRGRREPPCRGRLDHADHRQRQPPRDLCHDRREGGRDDPQRQPEGAVRSSQAFAASSMVMKTAPIPWSASMRRSSIIIRWPRPITSGWQV